MKLSVTIFIIFVNIPMAFSSTRNTLSTTVLDTKNQNLYECFEATNDAVVVSEDPVNLRAANSSVAVLDYPKNKDNIAVEEVVVLFNSKFYRGIVDSEIMHLNGIETEGTKSYSVYEGWYVFELGQNTYHLILKKWVANDITQKYSTEIDGAENNLTPTLALNESETPELDSLIFDKEARSRIMDLQKAYQNTVRTRIYTTGVTDFVISAKGKDNKNSLKNLEITLPGDKLISVENASASARVCLKLNDSSMNGILQGIIRSAKDN